MTKITGSIQIYESNFGDAPSKGSAKVRRMNKRKLKKYLVRMLNEAWDSAKVW